MKLYETFGINLFRLRRAAGSGQKTLAHEARADRAYIGKLEGGKKNGSLDRIEKLARPPRVNPIEFSRSPPKAKRKS